MKHHYGMCIALTLAMCSVPSMMTGPAKSQVILARVEFESFTRDQQQWLWQKVDNYAYLESFVRVCGRISNIEQRMIKAVQDCATPNAMQRVIAVFRRKVGEYLRARNAAVCDTSEGKKLLVEVEEIFANAVTEATGMCRTCTSC